MGKLYENSDVIRVKVVINMDYIVYILATTLGVVSMITFRWFFYISKIILCFELKRENQKMLDIPERSFNVFIFEQQVVGKFCVVCVVCVVPNINIYLYAPGGLNAHLKNH